ncbi:unnamed protein product [Discula destructiva]
MFLATLLVAALGAPVALLLLPKIHRLVNYIAQILIDASKIDIEQITITSCTDTGFHISFTAKIYDTGPLPATISNMALSMHATKTGKPFARIRLPPITAAPSGTVCEVTDQRVEILDFAAFHTFNKNLLLQQELPTYLRGSGTLTLLPGPAPLSTEVRYDKVVLLRGLDGVHIDVLETRKASRSLLRGKPTAIEVDVAIASASPVSVDMGAVRVAIVFSEVRIARVEGELFLKKGENLVTFRGTMDFVSISKNLPTGVQFLKKDVLDAPDGVDAFVRGIRGEQCAWLDETVKLMNSRIKMGNTMADLLQSMHKVENEA